MSLFANEMMIMTVSPMGLGLSGTVWMVNVTVKKKPSKLTEFAESGSNSWHQSLSTTCLGRPIIQAIYVPKSS